MLSRRGGLLERVSSFMALSQMRKQLRLRRTGLPLSAEGANKAKRCGWTGLPVQVQRLSCPASRVHYTKKMVSLNIDLSFIQSLFPRRLQMRKQRNAETYAVGHQSCASRHSIDIQSALDPPWTGTRWKTNGRRIDMAKNYTDELTQRATKRQGRTPRS